jgi:hypothetical protein
MMQTMIRRSLTSFVPKRTYIDSVFDDTDKYPKVNMAWTRLPTADCESANASTFSMTGHGLTLFTRKRCAMYDKDMWTNTKRMWHMPSYVQGVTRINPFQLIVFGKHSYWLARVLKSYAYFCDLDKQTCVPLHMAGRGGKKLPEAVSRVPYSTLLCRPACSRALSLFVFGTPPNPKSFLIPPTGVAVFDIAKREPIRELPASRASRSGAARRLVPRLLLGRAHAQVFPPRLRQYVITFRSRHAHVWRADSGRVHRALPHERHHVVYSRRQQHALSSSTMGGVRPAPIFMQVHVPDVDLFDLNAQTWKVGKFADDSPFPLPRREPTSCAISPHSIAFGGGRTHYFDQNDVWILSFKDEKQQQAEK